jgi:signal transduction histidine kinase
MEKRAITPQTAYWLSVGLDALTVLIWLSGLALVIANRVRFDGNALFLMGLFGATAAAYCVTGTLIARREPSNVIAWLCLSIGPLLLVGLTATEYVVHALVIAPGSLPGAGVVTTLAVPTPTLAIGAMVLILYVFPTGHTFGRVWQIAMWTTVAALIVVAIASMVEPRAITNIWSDRLEQFHLAIPTSFGIEALRGIAHAATTVANLVFAAGAVAAVASLLVRRASAGAVERAQLRWLAYVVVAIASWIVVMVPIAAAAGWNETVGAIFWLVITPMVALGGPIAIGIAILRYRLWDIDVVIKKTVVFALVGGGLTLVSLAVLLLLPLVVVGTGSGWGGGGVIVVGVVIGTLFGPLRRLARRVADRLVYGERATPYEVLTEFSARVGETYASDDVLPRMASILRAGTGAKTARVLLRVGGELRDAAVAGTDAEGEQHLVAVTHQGEELGALAVTMAANDPLDPARERLVHDLAAQAGPVLRNVRLIEELRASRQRLVAAQDEERRRLERNIHDGVQQQLVALAVKLRLADAMIERDPAQAHEAIAALQVDAGTALDDLRDLARGIYPPLLADKGLGAALTAQAAKATTPVTIETDGIGRYPRDVEATIYFCALEALNNIAKYAEASSVTLHLQQRNGDLSFVVRDDGRGFDPEAVGTGSGLQGMADRLEAAGGSFAIRSAPGSGTTVTGTVPIP